MFFILSYTDIMSISTLFECDFQLADYLICPGFCNVQFRFLLR